MQDDEYKTDDVIVAKQHDENKMQKRWMINDETADNLSKDNIKKNFQSNPTP